MTQVDDGKPVGSSFNCSVENVQVLQVSETNGRVLGAKNTDIHKAPRAGSRCHSVSSIQPSVSPDCLRFCSRPLSQVPPKQPVWHAHQILLHGDGYMSYDPGPGWYPTSHNWNRARNLPWARGGTHAWPFMGEFNPSPRQPMPNRQI